MIVELHGDAIVDCIHDPAYGLTAVAQCAGTAHDFDPLGGKRIHGHAVIGTHVGYVKRTNAILECTYPVGIKTTNDGTTGARCESRSTHARHIRQGVSKVC